MYKIFIVEDEFLVREGIRNKINWENTQFMLSGEASDGEMALAMIQEIKPDILVTDIRMPFMDGLELSRIVKRTLPWIHIIILSGHDEFEYARDAISIGVDEYILKPINSSILLATLEKVAQSIEEEKKKRIDAELLRMQLESTNNLIIEHFLEELVIGAIGTSDAISRAQGLGIDLLAKRYVVVEGRFDFDNTENKSVVRIKANIAFAEDVIKRAFDFRDSCGNLKYGRIIQKAREFINSNYHDSGISLHTVAAVVNLSPNHFSTIFSQETGETFIEYLTRVRIENAKKLLTEGKMKTTDIAYAV